MHNIWNIFKLGIVSLVWLGSVEVMWADTLGAESFFINGDSIIAENAHQLADIYGAAAIQVREQDPELARTYRRKARQARRAARRHGHLQFVTAQKLIKLQAKYPDLANQMRRLRTEHGGRVQVMVTSYFRSPDDWTMGKTLTAYDQSRTHGLRLFTSRIVFKDLILLERQDEVIHISLASDAQLSTFRHELGHAAYAIAESEAYYHYLKELLVSNKVHHGHTHHDLSGVWAEEYEALGLAD